MNIKKIYRETGSVFRWLTALMRPENIRAIVGSLKRKVSRGNFLKMKINLKDSLPDAPGPVDGMEIKGYTDILEERCIDFLNDVGSLGYWNSQSMHKMVLSTVDRPDRDVFVFFSRGLISGFTVVHKKDPALLEGVEVGYIAIGPEARGRNLGYKLLMHVLSEIRKRDIFSAYLYTDSFRTPAIKTYLKCGFYPCLESDNDRKRWQKMMKKIGKGYGNDIQRALENDFKSA